jgi:hypothetical protein
MPIGRYARNTVMNVKLVYRNSILFHFQKITSKDIGPHKVAFECGAVVFSMSMIDIGVEGAVRVTNMCYFLDCMPTVKTKYSSLQHI